MGCVCKASAERCVSDEQHCKRTRRWARNAATLQFETAAKETQTQHHLHYHQAIFCHIYEYINFVRKQLQRSFFFTLTTRKTAEDESKAPLYRVMIVDRWAPKRFPTCIVSVHEYTSVKEQLIIMTMLDPNKRHVWNGVCYVTSRTDSHTHKHSINSQSKSFRAAAMVYDMSSVVVKY